jgi:hypothetical protein
MGDFDNIKSRTFNYGNEKEAEWPSQFGTLDKTPMYFDKEKGCMVEGYPPPRQINDTAPMVLFDSMDEQYHHGVCRPIASRKEWQLADKESGSATLSPTDWKRNSERREALKRKQEFELAKDRRKASIEAVRAFNQNREGFEQKMRQRAYEQEQSAKAAGVESLITKTIKEEI